MEAASKAFAVLSSRGALALAVNAVFVAWVFVLLFDEVHRRSNRTSPTFYAATGLRSLAGTRAEFWTPWRMWASLARVTLAGSMLTLGATYAANVADMVAK